MFGNLVDILIKNDNNFIYIQELPINFVKNNLLKKYSESIIIYLNYGKKYGGKINYISNLEKSTYVFGKDRVNFNFDNGNKSNFIHPILEYYKFNKFIKSKHIVEDFNVNWNNEISHINPLKKFINNVFKTNFNIKNDISFKQIMQNIERRLRKFRLTNKIIHSYIPSLYLHLVGYPILKKELLY